MTTTKEAWDEVADRFGSLALKLKMHYEQAAEPFKTDGEVKDALQTLRDSIDEAFSAIGNAVADPAVKEDSVEVARSLCDALGTTFTDISDEMSDWLKSKKSET